MEYIECLKYVLNSKRRMINKMIDEKEYINKIIEKEKELIGFIDKYRDLFSYSSNDFLELDTNIFPSINSALGFDMKQMRKVINDYSDFDKFFADYPLLIYQLFFPLEIDIFQIISLVEKWAFEKRKEFLKAFFVHANSISTYISSIYFILDTTSIPMLCETFETVLCQSLRYQRMVLMLYDNDTQSLLLEKQMLLFKFFLNQSDIRDQIEKGHPLFIKKTQSSSQDELTILRNNNSMYIAPIKRDNGILGVLIMFDKNNGFDNSDILFSSFMTKILSYLIPSIQCRTNRKLITTIYQSSLDLFLKLSSFNSLQYFVSNVPGLLAEFFHCNNVRLFGVSKNGNGVFDLDKSKEDRIYYTIHQGLVGKSIKMKNILKFTNPECSIMFNFDTDRPSKGIKCNSILIGPIVGKSHKTEYAFVLYNKIGFSAFSQEDMDTLDFLCKRIPSLIKTLVETQKISLTNEEILENSRIFQSLFNTISSLTEISSFFSISSGLSQQVKNGLSASIAEIYYLDRYRNKMLSTTKNNEYEITPKNNSNDPIIEFSLKQMCRESYNNDNQRTTILCSLSGTENQPIGLLMIAKSQKSYKCQSSSSFLNTVSPNPSSNNISRTKSILQLKVEKLNSVIPISFDKIKNRNTENYLNNWRGIIGCILEASFYSFRLSKTATFLSQYNEIFSTMKETEIFMGLISCISEPSQRVALGLHTYSLTHEMLSILHENIDMNFYFKYNPVFPDLLNYGKLENQNFIHDYNVFSLNHLHLLTDTVLFIEFLGLIRFMNLSFQQSYELVHEFRLLHSPEKWEITVDRLQFFCQLVSIIKSNVEIDDIIISAITLHILSTFCTDVSNRNFEMVYTENSCMCKPFIMFILASSGCSFRILEKITEEQTKQLFVIMESLTNFDEYSSVFSGEFAQILRLIIDYSYLSRPAEIAKKFIQIQFPRELDDTEDDLFESLQRFQIEFITRSVIIPCSGELIKRGIRFDTIRKLITSTISTLTGASF